MLNTKENEFNSPAIFPLWHEPPMLNLHGRHRSTVGHVKIALPENIALLLYPHVDVPWSLCLRDDKNTAYFTIPRHGRPAWKTSRDAEAVSDWLNPISLKWCSLINCNKGSMD